MRKLSILIVPLLLVFVGGLTEAIGSWDMPWTHVTVRLVSDE